MSYDRCTCKGPWNIGLPFDHPIWDSIVASCPVHGWMIHHFQCRCSKCHMCPPNPPTWTGTSSNDITLPLANS